MRNKIKRKNKCLVVMSHMEKNKSEKGVVNGRWGGGFIFILFFIILFYFYLFFLATPHTQHAGS